MIDTMKGAPHGVATGSLTPSKQMGHSIMAAVACMVFQYRVQKNTVFPSKGDEFSARPGR